MNSLPPLRGVVAYLDTLSLYTKNDPAWILADLEASGAARVTCGRLKGLPTSAGYRFELLIQRPTPKTFEVAAGIRGSLIHAFHVARDFLTDTQEDAATLTAFLAATMTQPWAKAGDDAWVFASTFYSGRRSRFRFAVYGTRPSKTNGQPCAHVEARWTNAAAVRSAGIRNVRDLLSVDLTALAERRLWLETVSAEDLGRGMAHASRRAVEAANAARRHKVALPRLDPANDRRRGRLALGALQNQYLVRAQRAFDRREAAKAKAAARAGKRYEPRRFDADLIEFPGNAALLRAQVAANRAGRGSRWPFDGALRTAAVRRVQLEALIEACVRNNKTTNSTPPHANAAPTDTSSPNFRNHTLAPRPRISPFPARIRPEPLSASRRRPLAHATCDPTRAPG